MSENKMVGFEAVGWKRRGPHDDDLLNESICSNHCSKRMSNVALCQYVSDSEPSDGENQQMVVPRTRLSAFRHVVLQDLDQNSHEPKFAMCPEWIRHMLSSYFQVSIV